MSNEVEPLRRPERAQLCACAVVGAISVVVWWVTMASAPLYSHPPNEDLGNSVVYPLLILVGFVGGFVVPRYWSSVGVSSVLPALGLSPFTTPRGDNDGLWALVIPLLAIVMLVAWGAARLGSLLRPRVDAALAVRRGRDEPRPSP